MFNYHLCFNKQKVKLSTIACCALFGSGSSLAATNLILNGSFESPAVAVGSNFLTVAAGASTIPSWSVIGPSGSNIAIIEASYNLPDGAGISFRASEGTQSLDLTGAGVNLQEGVQQSVALGAGSYQLSFDVGNVSAASAQLGTQSAVSLLINGTPVQTFTNALSTPSVVNWRTFTYFFTTTGGATSIAFLNADAGNDNYNGLDNVLLTAVPEPSIFGLMIFGLAAVAQIARKRIR